MYLSLDLTLLMEKRYALFSRNLAETEQLSKQNEVSCLLHVGEKAGWEHSASQSLMENGSWKQSINCPLTRKHLKLGFGSGSTDQTAPLALRQGSW